MNKRTLRLGVALLFTGIVSPGRAVELHLGHFDLSPCRKVEWENNGPLGATSPTIRNGPQKIHVRVIVDGPNINLESRIGKVQACSLLVASKIGMPILAWNPSRSNELFKSALMNCLSERDYPDEIFAVALKTESHCEW